MSVTVITGNIFTSESQTIVNTINCVGVMGAGIALECRLRYPEMYERYVALCSNNQIDIGRLWIYKASDRWILNFPTKRHWRYPSKVEFLHAGLRKFIESYREKGIESIAFPLLGADKGGIPQSQSLSIMKEYLERAEIHVEIYKYDPCAKDDLFEMTRKWLLSRDVEQISLDTKLGKNYVVKVLDAMQSPDITQLNQLARVRGIGIKTLEKVFDAARSSVIQEGHAGADQKTLL